MSKSSDNYDVIRTGIVCKKHVDCINNFLKYRKDLLEHTVAIWKNRDGQPKQIPEDKKSEYANDLYSLGYIESISKAMKFIQHWNESPNICCMVEGMERKGRCVKHRSQCYNESQFDGSRRTRSITLDELLDIKLKAGIVPSDSECLSDKHCKEKNKVSWRDPFRYRCHEYKCVKELKEGRNQLSRKEHDASNLDISSFDSLEQLEFMLDNK